MCGNQRKFNPELRKFVSNRVNGQIGPCSQMGAEVMMDRDDEEETGFHLYNITIIQMKLCYYE